MLSELLQYGFVVRGLEAGIIVGLIAPLIGIFLVLRRYSLIADTLSHVSLAGIAIGLLSGIPPILAALGATIVSSLGIEYLRTSKKVYGESALALFLSGSLAVAIVLLSWGKGLNSSIVSYLFGSIMTVTQTDVWIIAILAITVVSSLFLFFKELVYISFDEESAQVSGIPTKKINMLLIILTALTVSLSIPIVGILLISALIVVPVITALQFKRGFITTLVWAEVISVFSVIAGIVTSFYLNLSTGGTIVLLMMFIFIISLIVQRKR